MHDFIHFYVCSHITEINTVFWLNVSVSSALVGFLIFNLIIVISCDIIIIDMVDIIIIIILDMVINKRAAN